jgi:hypothetical protein
MSEETEIKQAGDSEEEVVVELEEEQSASDDQSEIQGRRAARRT